MAIASRPSHITLPPLDAPGRSILDFLCSRFPRVGRETWERRIAQGKVLGEDGRAIGFETRYLPRTRLYYFREVEKEPSIPFSEEILFSNDHLVVCCKPHFLPVTPGGRWVEESLVTRVRKRTGIEELAPVHRIDRETAGVVMLSADRRTTGLYGRLFARGEVEKEYLALSRAREERRCGVWSVESRIEPGEPWFRMKEVDGPVNARSRIALVAQEGGVARFELRPLTGKTHQLRLHLSSLGYPILNDRLYPELAPQTEDDFRRPLQLLARTLRFRDPLSGKILEFGSGRTLDPAAALPEHSGPLGTAR